MFVAKRPAGSDTSWLLFKNLRGTRTRPAETAVLAQREPLSASIQAAACNIKTHYKERIPKRGRKLFRLKHTRSARGAATMNTHIC